MVGFSSRPISSGVGLIWPWLILILPGVTNAQTPAVPTPPSVNPVPVSPPATAPPAPVTPPTPTAVNRVPVSPPATAREGQLETRVRELETILRAGANREAQLEDRLRRLEEVSSRTSALAGTAGTTAPTAPAAGSQPERDLQLPARIAGVPVTRAGTPVASMPVPPLNIPGKVKFGPGFEISSEDGEYQVQFHNLTQLDGRFYGQSSQVDAHQTFTFPREWFIFSGRLTKPFEYFVSFSETYNSFNFLWCWLNIHYDDRLQFKVGRMFTPFGYEWWIEPTAFLINPERSHFINNIAPVSDIGLTAWGQLAKKRIEYAVGIYNGTRNSTFDLNDSKDIIAFLNFKPFLESDIEALKYLNVGGSVDTGNQFNTPLPPDMRTNVQTSAAVGPALGTGPEFLVWNSNVRESGWRAFWDLHAAYYYRHLSLIAEWQSGFQDYAFANTPNYRTHVPIGAFYVQSGYFLTGETVTSRGVVEPIRNFDIRKGKWGPGAIELAARYQLFHLGSQIFTAGLVDQNNWTNQVSSVDVGVNWYLTRFIKVYMGWEHDMFAQPVTFAPGRQQLTNDQAWLKFQIFF